jgi:hypothetical protein
VVEEKQSPGFKAPERPPMGFAMPKRAAAVQ